MPSLVIGAVMISFSGVWVKVCHVTPTVSAFYRVFFGGIILLCAALFRREMVWHSGRQLLLGLTCGFILLLQPALAFVWDVAIFQRPTSLTNWIGVSIVLFAIYFGSVKPSQS